MARHTTSRRRLTQYYIVGGNAVSAFLSWRLQATNSCDVTLVWKSGFEQVSQYGVSFKSKQFGNERFKPRHVVRTPEEGILPDQPFDYVILCVKALPDVYDLAAVIESVVTPRHTCILVNTSNTVGVETHLETRFPTNVILSLVSNIDLAQTGVSEFEHLGGSSKMWVGPATSSDVIPESIQNDMASALAITLSTGQVDCQVSENIRQQQYERMIGPIAFHPVSVLFECPNHAQLLEKVGVRQLICGIIDELITLATSQKCSFPHNFKDIVIEQMIASDKPSTMYQDFQSRRPMEVEMYLGSPIKFAQEKGINVPRIETVYSMVHYVNISNQQNKPQRPSPSPSANHLKPPSGPPPPRQMTNGSSRGLPRRAPPPNGMPNGMQRPPVNGPRVTPTEPDDPNNLEEFSHLVLYDDPETGNCASAAELALRERELALRQKELKLREREMQLRRGKIPSRARRYDDFDEDDGDDDDFTDIRPMPQVDPDSIDMISVTSRRNRKAVPEKRQLRKDPEGYGSRPPSSFAKYFSGNRRKQASERIVEQMPTLHDTLWENPMMTYASNRVRYENSTTAAPFLNR
ncbi:hypothetical protein KEM56_001717 [Ascosphaera pollenicola]|nr:hypothetical protein KEM56_001717 [Ascosphaera pollenicola]